MKFIDGDLWKVTILDTATDHQISVMLATTQNVPGDIQKALALARPALLGKNSESFIILGIEDAGGLTIAASDPLGANLKEIVLFKQAQFLISKRTTNALLRELRRKHLWRDRPGYLYEMSLSEFLALLITDQLVIPNIGMKSIEELKFAFHSELAEAGLIQT